jgi:ATP-dependent DNA helicase RecQ
MAAQLPSTSDTLRRVSGVGERKLADFGDTFLASIGEYVEQTGAQPTAPLDTPSPATPRRATTRGGLPATVKTTLDLFEGGLAPNQIAAERGLTLITVEDHLAAAVDGGLVSDLDRLVPPHKRRAIEAAIAEVGGDLLKPIKEHLGDAYSYAEIKYTRAALSKD